MKTAPRFKIQEEEAEYWMTHDTTGFWDTFEEVNEPIDVTSALLTEITARHEKTKPISLRLYLRQLRMAKAIAQKHHMPYQTLLRTLIDRGLAQLTAHPPRR